MRSRWARALGFAVAAGAAFGWVGQAQAEEPPPVRRIFAAGSAFGAGVVAVSLAGGTLNSGVLPAGLAPTLELQGFVTQDEWSFDVSVPVVNMILWGALAQGFYWNSDFYFSFNTGSGIARFVGGPGLGFEAVRFRDASAGGARFLGQLGLEALTPDESFAFRLLARPFGEVVFGNGQSAGGGGALLVLSFEGCVVAND